MSQVPVNLEISTLRAIALSQDQLASLKSMQQLLNTLSPGQIIEATLQVEVINNQLRPLLIVNDTRVIISNEQLQDLPVTQDSRLLLSVVDVNSEQLTLKVVTDDKPRTDKPGEIPPQPTQQNPDKVIDTAKLLQLIQTINPDFAITGKPGQELLNYIQTNERPLPQQPLPKFAQKPLTSNAIPLANASQTIIAKDSSLRSDNANSNSGTQSQTRVNINNVTSALGSIQSRLNVPLQATVDGIAVTTDKLINPVELPPSSVSNPISDNENLGVRISGNDDNVSLNQTAIENTSQQPSQAESRNQSTDASKQSVTISQGVDQSFIQTSIPDTSNSLASTDSVSSNQVVTPTSLNTSSEQSSATPIISAASSTDSTIANQPATGIKAYSQPDLKVAIEIPNREAFPILAQSVTSESSRLASTTGNISRQLNSLFAQLARLNQWQNDNKRPLRSESGQLLNKAGRDTSVAIKDIQRYIPQSKQLNNAGAIKKAIKQSGNFLEAKMASNRQATGQTQSSIHQDLKANLQRLISSSLYHIAKIQTSASTVSQATGQSPQAQSQGQAQTQNNLVSGSGKLPTDLVKLVKQKLHNMTSQRISNDLPTQLLRILKQILNETNRTMSRLQSNQLSNLRSDNLTPQWFFEIPVWQQQDTELIQLLLQRDDKAKNDKQDKIWSLVLQFDSELLGKIRAIMKWQNSNIDIQFLAEHPQTVELIQQEISYVHDSIRRNNITLEQINIDQAELREMSIDYGVAS